MPTVTSLSSTHVQQLPPALAGEASSWMDISSGALANNISEIRRVIGAGHALGVVLKGNAYGHGLWEVFSCVHGHADAVFVIDPCDVRKMRKWERDHNKKQSRIIVLGALTPDEAWEMTELGAEWTLGTAQPDAFFQALRKAQPSSPSWKRCQIHVHIDSGLGREGFLSEDTPNQLEAFEHAKDIVDIRGFMSHFANTEDVTEQDYAKGQMAQFDSAVELFCRRFPALAQTAETHMAASAAALILPQSRKSLVRVGISLYGFWPSPEARLSARAVHGEATANLQTALVWTCKSQTIKKLPGGSFVGYGCTWRCERPMVVALFPVGYFDGYPRALSGKAWVDVQGHRCQVLGRVMMNHIIVDITPTGVSSGEVEATLLGKNPSGDLLASWAQTISYEIMTRLGSHVRRRVV